MALTKDTTLTLASGNSMPQIALGTWKSGPGDTEKAVYAAIEAGYRNIDAANDYNNEHEVGAAIARAIKDGLVTREDLFVQCKLWNSNHRPEHVMADLQQTLTDLQLEYVDNYVIHWAQAVPSTGKFCSTRLTGACTGPADSNPMFPVDSDGYFCTDKESHYVETWKFMETLVTKGLCRNLGLSNFNKAQIAEVVAAATVAPVCTLQNECHPYLQQKDLIDYCRYNKIHFQAYSPLGSGDTHLGALKSPTGCIPLKDPLIAKLAEKYNKNPGQVMLRWALQRGYSVVSKSANPVRVKSNIDVYDFEISAEDMASFDSINCGWRHLLWMEASDHPDYPFKDEIPTGYVLQKAPTITSSGN